MKLLDYLKSTKAEMQHVNWPSQKQVAVFTALVVAMSLATSLILGAFDFLFSTLFGQIVVRGDKKEAAPPGNSESATSTEETATSSAPETNNTNPSPEINMGIGDKAPESQP